MNGLRKSINLLRPNVRCIQSTSQLCKMDIVHVDGNEPWIPEYKAREDESLDRKKARLLYQSRKRGMLENGLLLSTFAKRYLQEFDENQLKQYDHLINHPSNDWDIFYWACEKVPTPQEYDNDVMKLLKKHVKNDDRQSRIFQPEL